MNRRFLLLALAVVVSAALFGAAKTAASWRPAKVALIETPKPNGSRLAGPTISFGAGASEREIIFPLIYSQSNFPEQKIFDLATSKVRDPKIEGIVAGGNGRWEFKKGQTPQLSVRQNEVAPRSYYLPTSDAAELNAMPRDMYQESTLVAANDERLEMVIGAHYYRWNAKSGALERKVNCDMESELGNQAIARDGQSLINGGLGTISALSTQTGEFTRHDKIPHAKADGAYISAFGAFCVYLPVTNSSNQTWSVLDTATARDLWNFTLGDWQTDVVLFSPDEKYLVIGRGDRKIWELHDAKTGAIVRELPMVPDTNIGAFAPDGATLYSVAGGVLYRQRAR